MSAGGASLSPDAWRLTKARTLVKLLALAPGHRLHLDQVGEMLWPDRDGASVRNNLHQVLHAARAALATIGCDGHQVLSVREGMLRFDEDLEVTVDVDDFRAAVEVARGTVDLAAHQSAADLYSGELLPEDRYEDWADAPREALRDEHASLLLGLARLHRDHGDPEAAIDVVRHLREQHPLHEQARRDLMELLAAAGRRQDALAEFEALRDLLRKERAADPDPETRQLYRQLLVGSVEGPEPAILDPASRRTNNLPAAVSSFVGRDREQVEVQRLLERTRLLTVTGVGGAGKTRLAIEVARQLVRHPRDGVWLVDLAPISDGVQVPMAVASAVALELPERGDFVAAIVAQLAQRELVLVLDNCEHVIAACAELLTAVLRGCPDVLVLATSREALRIDGEVAWRVPSLSLPDLHRLPELSALARLSAIRLFCDRASAVSPAFELTPQNAATVAELCVRLDGMPLALELAAVRVRVLSPSQILERLGDSLDVLAAGSRTSLTRQRTLTATLDWSHDLLPSAEQAVLRRLAVFAGSFPLAAAEYVCSLDSLRLSEVLGHLAELVDKSLVVVEQHHDVVRYRLLEIVRQYARERLVAVGEHGEAERRHRAWYRSWAQQHDPERAATVGEVAIGAFDTEHDNLRAALRTGLEHEPVAALELAASLWRFWLARGHFAEGRRWLEGVLDANPDPTALRARALVAIAVLDLRCAAGVERPRRAANEIVSIHRGLGPDAALAQAEVVAAILRFTGREDLSELDRACALAEELGATHILAAAAHTRGVLQLSGGRPDEARTSFQDCERLLDGVDMPVGGFFPAITPGFSVEWDEGRPRIVFEETLVMGHRLDTGPARAFLRYSQAWAAQAEGDLDGATGHAEDSLVRFEAQGWQYGVALTENLIGNLHRRRGDDETARRHLERALSLRLRLGDRRETGVTLTALGLAATRSDPPRAQEYLRRALRLFERIDDGFGEAGALLNIGVSALRSGDPDTAQRLFVQFRELWNWTGPERPSGWAALMQAEIAEAAGDSDAAAKHRGAARETFELIGERLGLDWCDEVDAQHGPAVEPAG